MGSEPGADQAPPVPPTSPGSDASSAARRAGGNQAIPRPAVWRPGARPPWSPRPDLPRADEIASLVAAHPLAEHVPPFPDARSSAVMIVLADGPVGAEVLLTRRAMHLRSHRGEVSFPGGRIEPGETAEAAALREADEEVALPPSVVRVAGRLDALSTVVSRSFIVPVVGTVAARPHLVAAADEVERAFWVPLAELTRQDTYRQEWWGDPPLDRPMFFFELDDETVWGATARMLYQLLRIALRMGDEPPSW